MNNYHFKVVKFQGDFVWHSHDDTDEVFIGEFVSNGKPVMHMMSKLQIIIRRK
jgi:mannose-6-phosphate isomerase-like protein (cupin superfamily)